MNRLVRKKGLSSSNPPTTTNARQTNLENGPSKTKALCRFRYAPKLVAAKSSVESNPPGVFDERRAQPPAAVLVDG
jgi:hypothetical protein